MSAIEKYDLALEVAQLPMSLAGADGQITLANTHFCELFGYENAEMIGLDIDLLIPDTYRKYHSELITAYFKAPTKRQMGGDRELSGLSRSGEVIPLELGLEPVDVDGKKMVMLVAVDIRQRRQHEQHLRTAMDAAASSMIMVGTDGRMNLVNKSALSLFGYTEDEMIGQRIEMLVPKEFQRVHPVYTGSFLVNGVRRSMGAGEDLYGMHKKGHRVPVEIALTPVETQTGKSVVCTIVDLTERRAARMAVELKTRELEALNSELTQFTYSASHDLKAPLSSIAGLLSLCIEDLEANNIEEVRENLNKAMAISSRSASKVENVLNISRTGREDVPFQPVDVDMIVDEIWEDLTAGMPKTEQFPLQTEFLHQEPAAAHDATLKVVLENLMSNALHFQDPNKKEKLLKVSTITKDQVLHFCVEDNGVGIPDDKKDRVFDLFNKFGKGGGDGLGLALARKQVERMGGVLRFESRQGEGTKFSFGIPQSELAT